MENSSEVTRIEPSTDIRSEKKRQSEEEEEEEESDSFVFFLFTLQADRLLSAFAMYAGYFWALFAASLMPAVIVEPDRE